MQPSRRFAPAASILLALILFSSPVSSAAPSVQRWYSGTLSIPQSPPLAVRLDIIGGLVYVQDNGQTIQQARVRVSFDHRTQAIRIQFLEVFSNCGASRYTDTLTGTLNHTSGLIRGTYRSAGPHPFSGSFALRPGQPVSGEVNCQLLQGAPVT